MDHRGRFRGANRDRASSECSQPEERVFALSCKRPGTSRAALTRGIVSLGKGEGHALRGAPSDQPPPNSLFSNCHMDGVLAQQVNQPAPDTPDFLEINFVPHAVVVPYHRVTKRLELLIANMSKRHWHYRILAPVR